jgi:hypothetical protein
MRKYLNKSVQINEQQESIENLPSTQTTPPKQTSPEQESIATLPSTQTKPQKENSTLVVATLNRAETPKQTSNQTESPNSLNNTSTRTDANKKYQLKKKIPAYNCPKRTYALVF